MLHFFQQLMQRIAKWKSKRLAEKLANKKTEKGTSDKVIRQVYFYKVLSGLK